MQSPPLKHENTKSHKNYFVFFIVPLCFRAFVASVVFVFFLIPSKSYSQNLKKLLKQGDEAMNDKDYFSAAQIYNQIILLDSTNLQYFYT